MQEKTVHIPNISCIHCVNTIKRELGDLDGIINVEGSPVTKNITIQWEDTQDWDTIRNLLDEIGYPPE
ncbi:MAG: heavy-metal-associated domain-containing protein [Candidatus Latescibacteria bacterium]|nr:heavy-metal-associated domain-containing protein [Candidatus Latescibacterota bacterium]